MSVLSFPRIYFNGKMEWNSPTGNSNDIFPLYDASNVELNWGFLADLPDDPITRENVRQKLHEWMIKNVKRDEVPSYVYQVPTNNEPTRFPYMPAEWDWFGDNACSPVNYEPTSGDIPPTYSRIIGGQTNVNDYVSDDPLLGMDFQILGNPFGGTDPTPGRFVDISPWQNTFTALYFDKLQFGDETTGLVLKRQYRMLDRFLNFNWGAVNGLTTVTVTWQTCFPRENITWHIGDSALLQKLKNKLDSAPTAQGLMVRFSAYLTLYEKNGIFNAYPEVSFHDGERDEITKMYRAALENSSKIFFNPAYSNIAGSIGIWYADEFPTAPGGRRLQSGASDEKVKVVGAHGEVPIPLGVTLAELHGTTLSLDVLNTLPFNTDKNVNIPIPEKFDLGDLAVQVDDTEIARITYADYCQAQFDQRSGLMDIPLSEEQATLVNTGTLKVIQVDTGKTVLSETPYTAEIIESGTFLDIGEQKTLNIMLQYQGQPVPAGTKIWITQYGNPYNITTSDYYLGFDDSAENVDFTLYTIKDGKSEAQYPQFEGDTPIKSIQQVQATRANIPQAESTTPSNAATTTDGPVSYRTVVKTPVGLSLDAHVSFCDGKMKSKPLKNGTVISYQAIQVTADRNGIAQVTIKGESAGFPTLLFSFSEEPDFKFSFPHTEAYTDFMAPIRVLPNNATLLQEFVDKWNAIYQATDARQRIWDEFIYPKILEVFYYMYPIMDKYMPLDQLSRVEGAVDQLLVLISTEYREESTLAMPITRDLPASSRAVLELWASKLVKRNYPPRPLSVPENS